MQCPSGCSECGLNNDRNALVCFSCLTSYELMGFKKL